MKENFRLLRAFREAPEIITLTVLASDILPCIGFESLYELRFSRKSINGDWSSPDRGRQIL